MRTRPGRAMGSTRPGPGEARPTRADLRVQAAICCEGEGRTRKAEREYLAALEIAPHHPVALNNLGLLLAARGRFKEALRLFARAVRADPRGEVAHLNLAGALREVGDAAGATQAYSNILAANPHSRAARLNLANVLRAQGDLGAARPYYMTLLQGDPRDGLARWNLAALDGLAGDFNAAFAGFALHHALQPAAPPPPGLARWRGEPLGGRRILLEAHQGLGDTIMFARFARLVRDRGGRVILRAQRELAALISQVEGVERFAPADEPAPGADLWFPLADLPALPGFCAPDSCAAPYIGAPADRAAPWAIRLPQTGRLRVGLVWAGNPTHPDDRNRSIPLQTLLAALSEVANVELVSLQKGARAPEADGAGVTRADLEIADFLDTAAALARLDLLISVDTSVLHLAGAMGRPAWALLPFAPDWRWRIEGDETPWYPSLRLLRQPRPGDWTAVVAQAAAALRVRAPQPARQAG